VAIIGLGPAGLQAAIHAARKRVKVIAIGKSENSSLNRAELENYLGIPMIKGEELLRIGREQATGFGAELVEEDVMKLTKEGERFKIVTDADREVFARSVIMAMGISRAKLGIPGEKDFLGKGVSYCASCDAGFFRGRIVAVIGEGSEAAESAMLLSEYASKVFWVHRALKVSPQMLEKVKRTKVEMLEGVPLRVIRRGHGHRVGDGGRQEAGRAGCVRHARGKGLHGPRSGAGDPARPFGTDKGGRELPHRDGNGLRLRRRHGRAVAASPGGGTGLRGRR